MRLNDDYRFTERDVDGGWDITWRYFSSKGKTVSEAEWELACLCRKAEEIYKRTRVYPTLAEVRAEIDREAKERGTDRITTDLTVAKCAHPGCEHSAFSSLRFCLFHEDERKQTR
jgi:hypothetical protein